MTFVKVQKKRCKDAGLLFMQMSNFDECGDLKISIDKSRLIQVLTLLLDNASKFSKEGKVIVRSIAEVDLENNYVSIKLGLTDQGCGVEAFDRESIYLPMSQGSNNFSRSSEGSGMGLAIAKKIILSFPEGKIGHHSSSKKGTCFWISFRASII